MRFQLRKPEQPRSGARRDLRQERFAAYFPRVFAYACAATGDDNAARDVATAAFSSVFMMPDMREGELEIALFKAARELCASGEYRVRHNDGLNPRERDVISLVFDGQLGHAKIGVLLGVGPEVVSMTLARGLRKLRANLAAQPAAGTVLPTFS